MVSIPCISLQSIHYPTNTLLNIIHMTYINFYMFRHRGAIFKELLQQSCASQPANIYFVLSYKRNYNVRLKIQKKFKHIKLIVMIVHSVIIH